MNLPSLQLSASEASARTKYSTSYVANLCRTGKVRGERIGNKWFIDEASLNDFVERNTLQKKERATELAKIREEEYKKAQKDTQCIPEYKSVGLLIDKKHKQNEAIEKPQKAIFLNFLLQDSTQENITPIHNAFIGGATLALAFVCMFSAYGAVTHIFSQRPYSGATSFTASVHIGNSLARTDGISLSPNVLKGSLYSYVRVGEITYSAIQSTLHGYSRTVLVSGKIVRSTSIYTRDTFPKVAISVGEAVQNITRSSIAGYTNMIYAFVDGSPRVADTVGDTVFAVGHSVMSLTNKSVVATAIMYKNFNAFSQELRAKQQAKNMRTSGLKNSAQTSKLKINPFAHIGEQ